MIKLFLFVFRKVIMLRIKRNLLEFWKNLLEGFGNKMLRIYILWQRIIIVLVIKTITMITNKQKQYFKTIISKFKQNLINYPKNSLIFLLKHHNCWTHYAQT